MMSLNLISLSITLQIPYTEHNIIYGEKNKSINTCTVKCNIGRTLAKITKLQFYFSSTLLACLNILSCTCTWSRCRFLSKPVLFVTQYSKQVQILCCCWKWTKWICKMDLHYTNIITDILLKNNPQRKRVPKSIFFTLHHATISSFKINMYTVIHIYLKCYLCHLLK